MPFCSKCGHANNNGVHFCTSCGAMVMSQPAPVSAAAPKDETLTGRVIEGKYRFDDKLGAGGMGTVYRGTRLLIGDTVAIKVLNTRQSATAQTLERFRREAVAAARLKHSNAVQIYDFGQTNDGLLYLIMELAEGESLRSLIKKRGPLEPKLASEILNQICAALDEAHQHNIIHRDIKPDNVVVKMTASGPKVKVLDFGIARLSDLTGEISLTQGGVIGTPHYMSPEQCLGEELDKRSDIYSLGIVLFEMLSGTVPFEAPTLREIINKQITQPPPPIRSRASKLTASIESVVTMAMEKDREARPRAASTLAKAFTNALNQPATAAIPAPAPAVKQPSLPPQTPSLPPQPPVPYYPQSGQAQVPSAQPVNHPQAGQAAAPYALPVTIPPPEQKRGRGTMPFVITLLIFSLAISGAFLLWVLTADTSSPRITNGNGAAMPGQSPILSLGGATLTARPTAPGNLPRLPSELAKYPGGVQLASVGAGNQLLQVGALATSLLPPQNGVTFNAVNVLDNDPATFWVEGDSGPGINQSLIFAFVNRVRMKGIRIAPGNFKSRADWEANNRVASILIQLAENDKNQSDWKATLGTRLENEMKVQIVKFDPIPAQYVRIVISDVYQGNSGSNLTMISQIVFDYEKIQE